MCNLFWKKYSILDLKDQTEITLVEMLPIRQRANVLVIDDDEVQSGDPMVEYLRRHGFHHVQYYKVLERIEDVADFDLILCDICGVGESLNYEDGLDLARNLKKLYPTIGIITFSANRKKIDDSSIDGFFPKDARATNRNEIIDSVLKKVFDPIANWKIFRATLLEHDVSIYSVAKLESLYVRKLLQKKPIEISDIKKIVNDISSVMTITNHLLNISTIWCN